LRGGTEKTSGGGERGWARRLPAWRPSPTGFWVREVEIGAARYFVLAGPFEVVAWAEPRDLGGRYRVEFGSFSTEAAACAACEQDARARLQRAGGDEPVDIRIAQPRRRRGRG
jgi:hypothetical protein